jgi:hypothetical protein
MSSHDDTLKKLGTIREQDEGRDAIHIAVLTIPVTDQRRITPGQEVDALGRPTYRKDQVPVGIVDPFLPGPIEVQEGQWFYVYLFPGTISGLRHVWTHEAFPEEPIQVEVNLDGKVLGDVVSKSIYDERLRVEAVGRVRDFCDTAGVDYDSFVGVLQTGRRFGNLSAWGEYVTSHGSETDSYDIPDHILRDVERITGKPLAVRPTGFSCSC